MTNFKKEMFNNYCKLSFETNCFIKLLNGEKANCLKIREINKKIDILLDGAILITGTNKVDYTQLKESYLSLFNDLIIINNSTYINSENKILNYIAQHKFINYDISEYIASNNSELNLDNINIMNQFIKINNTKISISFILLIFSIIFLIFILYIKYRNFIFVTKKQRPELENNTSQEIILKEENLNFERRNYKPRRNFERKRYKPRSMFFFQN